MPNRSFKLFAWLWTAAIVIGSLIPQERLPDQPFQFFDLFVHLVMYGLFSILWRLAIPKPSARWSIFWVGLALGTSIEFAQGFTGRFTSFSDMIFNALGSYLGKVIPLSFLEKAEKKL